MPPWRKYMILVVCTTIGSSTVADESENWGIGHRDQIRLPSGTITGSCVDFGIYFARKDTREAVSITSYAIVAFRSFQGCGCQGRLWGCCITCFGALVGASRFQSIFLHTVATCWSSLVSVLSCSDCSEDMNLPGRVPSHFTFRERQVWHATAIFNLLACGIPDVLGCELCNML